MVRILSSISNQQPSSNMDDSGFFSIQVSMKRSFVGLRVGGGGGGLLFISLSGLVDIFNDNILITGTKENSQFCSLIPL